MTQATQPDSPAGNTNTAGDKARSWTFTLNNYSDSEYSDLLIFCKKKDRYIIGKEVGKEGTPHLQGYFYHRNQTRWSTLKKLNPRMHLEKARSDIETNYNYCSKEGNFVTNIEPPKKSAKELLEEKTERVLKQYENVEWKPFQKKCINICEADKDPRKIYWFWEPTGNFGKSFITKYLFCRFGGIICSGKQNDVFNQLNTFMKENENSDPNIVICDIPRRLIDYFSYSALEKLKDGLVYSGKYEGGICLLEEAPHIICFANEPPDTSSMSEDRWVIERIDTIKEDVFEDLFPSNNMNCFT